MPKISEIGFGRWVALLTLSIVAVGCRNKQPTPPSPTAVDASSPVVAAAPSAAPTSTVLPQIDTVVLITVDALRGDQPWVGYDKVATPYLTELARSSIVYTHAYSLANLTTSSINALLASRYASELDRDSCTIGRYAIPGSLAPTLQAADIETLAAHGHAIFAGHTAPSLGFDKWRLIRGAAGRLQTMGAITGNDVAEQMILNLPRERKKKQFAWSHFVDPHDVYVAHPAHPATSSGDRRRYDSEVAYTDAAIGRVLEAIKHNGMTMTTAIVVTSDHGEAFGEHGLINHGFSLYEEEIRVPLILHIPGVEPRQLDVARSAIDIAPTIAELLGVTPPSSWRGVSLGRDLDNRKQPDARPVIVDVPEMQGRLPLRAVVRDNNKVVFTGASAQVYDLAKDPNEKSALSGDEAERAVARARQDLGVISSVAGTPCIAGLARGKVSEGL